MTYSKEYIKDLLANSDKAVLKGLLRIYSLQTATEQAMETTRQHNGVGFTGFDGEIMTSLAKFYIRTGFLTPKQMKLVRKKMQRYAGQLAKIANGEIQTPPLPVVNKLRGGQKVVKPQNVIHVPESYEDEERLAIQEEEYTPKQPLRW